MRAEVQEADAEKPAGTESLAKCEDLEAVKVVSALKTPKTLCRTRAEPERFITSSSAICAIVGDLAANGESHYNQPLKPVGQMLTIVGGTFHSEQFTLIN